MITKIIDYYNRSAKIEFIRNKESDTIVIFIHGILSETKDAFSLYEYDGYFWDILKNERPFSSFDFATFSYGRIDWSYMLEFESPLNSPKRLSVELNGMISSYDNVILIGHSQGGLIAKDYATQYNNQQGIFLITLHTPHRNKSLSVMRINNYNWEEKERYKVPHIFCGSIYDNKIVKPDNAFIGCADIKYLSKEQVHGELGHSHLSRSPSKELIELLIKNIYVFNNSGINRMLIDTTKKSIGNSSKIIYIYFSRSKYKLESAKKSISNKITEQPWKYTDYSTAESIVFNGCSINYFLKSFVREKVLKDKQIVIKDIDSSSGENLEDVNNDLCEIAFEKSLFNENPYKDLLFYTSDFPKKSLILNKEFFNIYTHIVNKHKMNSACIDDEDSAYNKSKEKFKKLVSNSIFNELEISNLIGSNKFNDLFLSIVKNIIEEKPKRKLYIIIYEMIKRIFFEEGKVINIRDIECIISRIMRSDGDLYWLDRDIKLAFK